MLIEVTESNRRRGNGKRAGEIEVRKRGFNQAEMERNRDVTFFYDTSKGCTPDWQLPLQLKRGGISVAPPSRSCTEKQRSRKFVRTEKE